MRDISRRSLLHASITAVGSSIAIAATAPQAGAQYYGHSYIEEVVDPRNMNDVLRWADTLLLAIRDHGLTPPEASRVLGIGFMAGFAAMNGIRGRYSEAYGFGRGPDRGDALAAYHVAAEISMTAAMGRSFRGFRDRMLAKIPNGEAKTLGMNWGKHVGQQIAKKRSRDGAQITKAPYYRGAMQKRDHVLAWEPTLPVYRSGIGPRIDPFTRPLLPSWGLVDPIAVRNIKTFRAERFPDPRSRLFWDDLKLVYQLGGTNSQHRSEDEREIAFFWEDGPRGATPGGHFVIIGVQLLQDRLDEYGMARALALMGMASCDAGISAWDSKYTFDILRPETVIRRRGHTIPGFHNAGVELDPSWSSLILTPPFPAYTSGHSCFGAAGARMIQHLVGRDQVKFTLKPVDLAWWPDQLLGAERHYTSIWETAVENGLSRIWGGVHWTFDHDQAMSAGRRISDEVFATHFRPIAR